MKKRCILFLRVSTTQQKLESQESELRKLAYKDGFTDDTICVIGKKESAVKLSEEEREGLQELYQEIEKGDVDCIRIWELSRLSRKMEVLYSIRTKLLDAKVQLYCSNPQFTLLSQDRTKTDKMSDLVFSIFGTLAEQEVIEKKERFARGKKEKAKQNRYTGGKVPFGYTIEKETKLIIPEEVREDGSEGDAVIVRNIFDMYENGMSQTAIAKYYYERGRTQLSMSLINNILTNEAYTGKTTEEKTKHAKRHGKDSEWTAYPRTYRMLITPEQFDRCREIAKANNTKLPKARNIYFADMLFRCPKCGRKMQPVGGRCIYLCRDAHNVNKVYSGARNLEQCDYRGNVSINAVDALAWDAAAFWEMQLTATQSKQQIQEFERKIIDLQERIEGFSTLRASFNERREKIGTAFSRGWFTEEKANDEASIVNAEESQIDRKEAQYREDIRRYTKMIADIKESETSDNIFRHILVRGHNISLINSQWRDAYLKEVNSNTSDEDKYRICHKNIQSISIEDIQVRYPFKHTGAKVVTARLFTVVPTLSNTLERCYIFLSNIGNGGLLIQCSPTKQEEAWKSTIEYVDGVYDLTKSMGVCTVDIAQRIRDEHKYDKRYRERAERQTKRAKAKGTALTVRELAELSGVPASTIHSAIQRGSLRATKHDKEYWISRQDADAYIAIKNKAKEA